MSTPEEIAIKIFQEQLDNNIIQKVMMNNRHEIVSHYKEIENLPTSLSRLCLPKRMSIESMAKLTESIVGNMMIVIDTLIGEGLDTNVISGTIFENTVFLSNLRAVNIGKIELENMIVSRRFYLNDGPVFTVRSSLALKMSDIDMGIKFPVNLIRSPHDNTYIECCEPEDRHLSKLRNQTGERIVEGAYINSFDDADISRCSDEMLKVLGLNRGEKTRKIEILFTISPFSNEPSENQKIIYDECESIFLYVQDESLPVEDIVDRHIRLTASQSKTNHGAIYGIKPLVDGFEISVKENIMFLMKVMAYISSDNPVFEKENELTKILHSLKNTSNKTKLKKLTKKKNSTYNKILLGTKSKYIPIDDFLDDIELRTGTRPFHRRGTWGVRWTGKGREVARISWIKPTIVNAPKDEDINILFKDYLII